MIKSTLLLNLLLAAFCIAGAQVDSSGVFTGKPGILPKRKGGDNEWLRFLERHISEPMPGAPEGPYTVVVSFIVDEKGNIGSFKAIEDPGYGTAEKVIKLIETGPGYTPAMVKGKPVKYRITEKVILEMHSS